MNVWDKLDETLMAEEKRRKTGHNAYDAGACRRSVYWKWVDEPVSDPIEPGARWKMLMGEAVHDSVARIAEKAFDSVPEVSVKYQYPGLAYPISIRLDSVFIDDTGALCGYELKSGYGNGIKAKKLNGPDSKDVLQVCVYLKFTEIKKFYLLYLARDNGYRMQFAITLKDDQVLVDGNPFVGITLSDITKAFFDMETSLKNGVVPDRDYHVAIRAGQIVDKFQRNNIEYKSDWQCSYCSWRTRCWKDDLEKYRDSTNEETFA